MFYLDGASLLVFLGEDRLAGPVEEKHGAQSRQSFGLMEKNFQDIPYSISIRYMLSLAKVTSHAISRTNCVAWLIPPYFEQADVINRLK